MQRSQKSAKSGGAAPAAAAENAEADTLTPGGEDEEETAENGEGAGDELKAEEDMGDEGVPRGAAPQSPTPLTSLMRRAKAQARRSTSLPCRPRSNAARGAALCETRR